MEANEVARMVNERTTYKPGWSLFAWVSDDDTVEVECEWRADNSSPRDVDPREWVWADQAFAIHDCTESTDEEIARQILDGLIGAETHETREFLRFDRFAPFHPHRWDGQAAYDRTSKEGTIR